MERTKILFVDDDPDISRTSKTLLEHAGYEVILAKDGKSGLERARKENPDVIVLDVMLPDRNGFSICRELKDDPSYSSIPIVLLTAIGSTMESYSKNIAKEHKADVYLAKPVDVKELIDTVNNLIIKESVKPKEEKKLAKILVVDDDSDFVEATRQILIANKYEVITAEDGEEGVARAKAERPDLILLDVIMPGKDGFTVCHELRQYSETSSILIIMLTAVGQQFSKPEYAVDIAIDHLADDYIDKPVDSNILLHKIQKHLTLMHHYYRAMRNSKRRVDSFLRI